MHTVFITGAAGYVGEMLCHQFSLRDDVRMIIALDKEPQSEFSKGISKLVYIKANMADQGWQADVAKYEPDIVIHTAWQIRAMYGEAQKEWRWNVEGSDSVFDFALTQPSVKRLVYFSTASSYSARKSNSLDHYFTESEGFRDDEYIYAKEKKVAEEHLGSKLAQATKEGKGHPQTYVLRLAAITGPRGRHMRVRFGLQSALQGNLKGGFVYKLVTFLTSFVPATRTWVRQFVHEDDVTNIVGKLSFEDAAGTYEIYNVTPPGEPVYARDMAKAVGKKVVLLPPVLIRIVFFVLWHATRGKVPTCKGSWRFYSYPVLLDGSKLIREQSYTYTYSAKDAFQYTDGRYESYIPEELQNSKSA